MNGKGDFMDDTLTRIGSHLIERVSGPMKLRLVLQPCMAAFFAIRAGLADAKMGNPPYFFALFGDKDHRRDLLKSGWKSVGKVFIIALILDVIYQIIAIHFVYPGEAIIVAFVLAILPYLVLRGLVARLARTKKAPPTAP